MAIQIERFNEYFRNWNIYYPAESAKRTNGKMAGANWIIYWYWEADTLCFYAMNRMTNDRHMQIDSEGTFSWKEPITPSEMRAVGKTPAEEAQLKEEYSAQWQKHYDRMNEIGIDLDFSDMQESFDWGSDIVWKSIGDTKYSLSSYLDDE